MNVLKHIAAAVILGAPVALPTIAVAEAGKQGVISFDYGSLDTLDALGLGKHVLAVPKQSLPEYLSDYAADDYADAGGMKSPDLELIDNLDPDLVLVTDRQAEQFEALQAVADLHNVNPPEGPFAAGVNTRVLELAGLFGVSDRAEAALDELWSHVDSQKSAIADGPEVLVVTHNDGNYSLRNEPVVSEVLKLSSPEVPEGVQTITRGTRTFTPLTAENMAAMAPDVLLVVDRSAAIGNEPVDQQALVTQLGREDIRVEVLSPGLWYLSGGGLQSVRLQVDEVVRALR